MKRITRAEVNHIRALPSCQGRKLSYDGRRCALGKLPLLYGTDFCQSEWTDTIVPKIYKALPVEALTVITFQNDAITDTPTLQHISAFNMMIALLQKHNLLDIIEDESIPKWESLDDPKGEPRPKPVPPEPVPTGIKEPVLV
jgi:hypothetical protein